MNTETLQRLQQLNELWANDNPTEETQGIHIAMEVMDALPDLLAAVKERDEYKAAVKAYASSHVRILQTKDQAVKEAKKWEGLHDQDTDALADEQQRDSMGQLRP
jgi:hypothetical protein